MDLHDLPEIVSEHTAWEGLDRRPGAGQAVPLLVGVGQPGHGGNGAGAPSRVDRGSTRTAPKRRLRRPWSAWPDTSRPLETVYVAVADYDPQVLNRVSRRRAQHGGEGGSVRRVDHVHLYSTKALPGLWAGAADGRSSLQTKRMSGQRVARYAGENA